MTQEDHSAIPKPISKYNRQANSIVECVHQTTGNYTRAFSVQTDAGMDGDDPWSGVLKAVAFAVRARSFG